MSEPQSKPGESLDRFAAADGAPAQLRLALVCYGGVSLAIYMHGITKELHQLVSASRFFDEAGSSGMKSL